MFRRTFIILALFIPVSFAFSQGDAVKETKTESKSDKPNQITSTDVFSMEHLSFNKKTDPAGKGELLQVEFALKNNTDSPMDLYIFMMGTIEEKEWVWNSFNNRKVALKKIAVKYFASTPDDKSQFEKEEDGKKVINKYPKDFKSGIDPNTGKAYRLESYLPVRTELLSHYRKKYQYFNYATIYIFDSEGELLFYQNYSLDKIRK
ncbi:MAG: hypothetical protein KA015_04650 [Spirochaetes bacterium]|nr:hypothetical protein [Spirochaetota bacterium]